MHSANFQSALNSRPGTSSKPLFSRRKVLDSSRESHQMARSERLAKSRIPAAEKPFQESAVSSNSVIKSKALTPAREPATGHRKQCSRGSKGGLVINFDEWNLFHQKCELDSDFSVESVVRDDSFENLDVHKKELPSGESLLTQNSRWSLFEEKVKKQRDLAKCRKTFAGRKIKTFKNRKSR